MKNILTIITLATLAFTSQLSSAGDIHQWRDKDGRLHFGDQQNAPNSSKVIPNMAKTVDSPVTETDKTAQDKLPGSASTQAGLPGYTRAANAPYDKGAPAGVTPEKIAQCSAMAREHMDKETSPAEIRAFFVKLESICPKTGFICKSYKLSPQKDYCEPVQYKDGKNQISKQVFNS